MKISEENLLRRLKSKKFSFERISFTDFGYWLDSDFALSSSPEYLKGQYYIQEAASQLPVQVLSVKKGEIVLDMCAAPGLKTTQLAQYMHNEGSIVALDTNASRINALKNNLERCGVKNVVVYQKDAAHISDLSIKFDKILLDAPCSGNFAVDPGWFERRSLEDIRIMARTQKALLKAAISVLKPSGTLLYSTCSLEREEDEEVVEWGLDNLPIRLEEIPLKIGEKGITTRTRDCKRFWPGTEHTQGFFMAKIRFRSQK